MSNLPKGWTWSSLGDHLAPGKRGLNPSTHPTERFELYSIPAYEAAQAENRLGSEIGSSKNLVSPGDVLLSKIVPHIRRSWVVPPAGQLRQIASSEWITFRSEAVHSKYLRHFLTSDVFHSQFMKTVAGVGGSLLRAQPKAVARILFPLPPLNEQRRIAAILNKVEALARTQEILDSTARKLRTAAINGFLSEVSTRPSPLGDHLDFLTSGSRGWAKYYSENGVPFLRIQNIGQGTAKTEDLARVAPPDTAEARRTRVEPGDVVMSITADLGRTAVIPESLGQAHINQHLAILRSSSLVPEYLSAFLESPGGSRQLQKKNRGQTKAGLNFDDVRSVLIPVPSVHLQLRFASKLHAIDRQLRLQVQRQGILNQLRSSLRHRAFLGEL